MADRWNVDAAPAPPRSRIAAPDPLAVVDARDHTDRLLTPPGSLGVLDTALDRVIACCGAEITQATLVLAAGDHLVADLGVTPYHRSVTAEVYDAATAGQSIGISAANAAGIGWTVVDAGSSSGDLVTADGMTRRRTTELIDEGVELRQRLAGQGLVVLGEVGVGNTTVAAALASALFGFAAKDVVGLGSGADSAMRDRKVAVVDAAVGRWRRGSEGTGDLVGLLSALGGPEFALMCGVAVGASSGSFLAS